MNPARAARSPGTILLLVVFALPSVITAPCAAQQGGLVSTFDTDQDGLPDWTDSCARLRYSPAFDGGSCGPMDLNPDNDSEPECRARERVAHALLNNGAFTQRIAFAVVVDDELHFADAFRYLGAGAWTPDPDGVTRLYRIGSTSKALTAVAAKALEEEGTLLLGDYVDDDDASQEFRGQRTLAQLLAHQGCFRLDSGAIHLFCYPGDLAAFWADPNDLISPHYDSSPYGNLGGGYEYSAFNYSLAGAHLAVRSGLSFESVLQSRVFDPAGMCTATLDGARAVTTPMGGGAAVSQGSVMHVGPYINLVSPGDPLCLDNYSSSDDVYGDSYSWQYYRLDETDAEARDPAGGVIASVLDMAHFASALLHSYHGTGGLLSAQGIRDLWWATHDLGCGAGCPYEPYYATGFFTSALPREAVLQCGHGGSRAGYASAFVLRPESHLAISILADADVSTVFLSDLAKTILDDFEN